MRSSRITGFSFGLLATVLWGSAYPLGRYMFNCSTENIDGMFLAFLLVFMSAVLLTPALFRCDGWKRLRTDCRRDLPLFLALAATGIVAEGSLILISTKYTTAARASLLANAAPVFTVLLSARLTGEKLGWKKVMGSIGGIVGLCVAMSSSGSDLFTGRASTHFGDMLAIVSGVCWAVYTVMGERLISKYNAMFCTGLLFWFGTLLMVPVLILTDSRISFSIPPKAWLGIIYLGALTRGFACALWYAALRHLRPGELGAFGYLTPILAWSMSALLFKEHVGLPFVAALVLILGSVGMMTGDPAERRISDG